MSRFVRLTVLTVLVVCITACGEADSEVAGPTWALTELNGAPPVEGTTIDMTISDDSVSGSSGCNQYTGSATVGDGEISLGPTLAGTMMACAEDVMAQEQAFIEALLAATTYEVAGDELSLSDANGTVLATFE